MKKFTRPKYILYFAIIFFSLNCFAYFESANGPKERSEMNGIKFDKYSNFTKKWKLVTFRYREDSTEIRATYANEKAWEGLTKLKPNYPTGAMFAKVAYLTEQDPAFPSSRQPLSTMRYQFMLKDNKKFKTTDGWGYALFNSKGKLFSGDEKDSSNACAACHRAVPERDFVFSRAIQLDPSEPPFPQFPNTKNSAFKFSTKKISSFDKNFIEHFAIGPKEETDILFLEGDIQKHGFSGTLSEVTPLLIEQSKKTFLPSTLFLDKQNFTIVSHSPKNTRCNSSSGQKGFHILIIFNNQKVSDAEICQ